MNVILASASPRRQELLSYIFDKFEVIPADIDETIPKGIDAEFAPEYLACQKAMSISKNHSDDLVIGSDTVVIVDGAILGKPIDAADAKRMLVALSGKEHYVVTGCAIFHGGRSMSFSEKTAVDFYSLSEEEIDAYIATGEPFDKAGGYGIQGFGSILVKGIHGDFFSVMGLPVARLKREIDSFLR